jgi:hypothetical protein
MSYNFLPKTDEELDVFDLVEDGEYNFEVVRSNRMVSGAGNPMAKMYHRYWDAQGKIHFIYDYLVFSEINLNIRKVKHFCDAVGLVEEYKRGEIPEDLDLLGGKFIIGTQEETIDKNGKKWPKKNVVTDYVKRNGVYVPVAVSDSAFDDKDIPF